MTSMSLRGPTGPAWDKALALGIAWAKSLTTRRGVEATMLADQRAVDKFQALIDAADPQTMAGRSDAMLYETYQRRWIASRDAAAGMLADAAGWDGDTWIGGAL
jgi:hypothetical protein